MCSLCNSIFNFSTWYSIRTMGHLCFYLFFWIKCSKCPPLTWQNSSVLFPDLPGYACNLLLTQVHSGWQQCISVHQPEQAVRQGTPQGFLGKYFFLHPLCTSFKLVSLPYSKDDKGTHLLSEGESSPEGKIFIRFQVTKILTKNFRKMHIV